MVQIGTRHYRAYQFTAASRVLTQSPSFSYSTGDYLGLTHAVKYSSTVPNPSRSVMLTPNYHVQGGGWITAAQAPSVTISSASPGDTVFYTFFWQVTDSGPNFDLFRAYIYPFGNNSDSGSGAYLTGVYLWKQSNTIVPETNPLALAQSPVDSVPGGRVQSCARYTLGNSGTNWTVTANGTTIVVGPAIEVATSQSIPLLSLPAGYQVTGRIITKSTTPFSGAGFTLFTSTVGDNVGGTTWYTSSAHDLMPVASNTNFQDAAPLHGLASFAGSSVNAVITSNQNLNASAITGAVDYRICWGGI